MKIYSVYLTLINNLRSVRSVMGCALALGVASAASVSGAVLLETSFENPPWVAGTVLGSTEQNGWFGSGTSGTDGNSVITSAEAHTGTQSLYLRDNVKTYIAYAKYGLGQSVGTGELEFWVKKDSDREYAGFYVNFADASGTTIFRVSMGGNFSIYAGDSTLLASVEYSSVTGADTLDVWNETTVNYDADSVSISLLFNDQVVMTLGEAELAQVGDLSSISQFTFNAGYYTGWGDAMVWVDDVTFTAIPEPASSAFYGLLGLGLIVAVLRRRFHR